MLGENWKLSGLPVMMLNGRPEATSRIGAKVQLLKKRLAKPEPESFPLWYTPLNTKRWRWSNNDVERSWLGK